MVIKSTVPEVEPERCGVCGSELAHVSSDSTQDASCARCGHLVWFHWEIQGDVDVMKPIGPVLRADSVDNFLNSVVIKPGTSIVLDLSEVRFFASSVFTKLINLKRRVGSVGGRFIIRNVDPELFNTFQITRLDHVFEIEH